MKKLLIIILLVALSLYGCNSAKNKVQPTSSSNNPVIEKNPTQSEPNSRDTSQLSNITFDDQKQVEQLITAYFTALENKDYKSAWELTSSEQQKSHPLTELINEHGGADSIKLVSMKGYLPPSLSQTGEVSPNTPTIWFDVKLDIKPSENSAWDEGINERFVMVIKDNDGKWKIDGLSTSPALN